MSTFIDDPLVIEVSNPETVFGGVQVFGATDMPIQIILHEGATGPAGPSGPPGSSGASGPDAIGAGTNLIQLVNGQSFIHVDFPAPLTDASWVLVACNIVNTTDPNPLNILPGIITAKSASGFTLQLSGLPDSVNYFLHWSVSGFVAPALPVTVYTLSGPSTGNASVASTPFTVALPVGGTLAAPVTITPHDGGTGTFIPATVILDTGTPSATFTYTPVSGGAKTISVTNDGGMTNPASLTYTVSAPVTPHLLNNLISYWKMDEASGTRNDSAGINHLINTAIPGANDPGSVSGKISNAAEFDAGGTRGCGHASNSSLQVTSDFTFSMWVKMTSVSTDQYVCVKILSGTGNDYVLFYSSAAGFVWYVGSIAVGSDYATAGTPVSAGVWTHVVCWYDHLTGQVYLRLNDAATYQSTTSPALVQTTGTFAFGGFAGVWLNAYIDEVGFWKRKLTAQEITALYNGGAGLPFSSFTNGTPHPADGDPVSTWPDSSGNGKNATQTGSARPIYKVNILNGNPIVRFTSAGLSGLNLASVISGADPWTIFAVMKQATGSSTLGSIQGNAAPSLPLGPLLQVTNSYIANRVGYVPFTTPSNVFHVFSVASATGGMALWTDGTSTGASGASIPSANSGDWAYIGYYGGGTPSYSNGDIAEIIIYNANLAGSIPNIEKYLGTKYGITVAGGTAIQPDDPAVVANLKGWWKADAI